MHRVDGLLLSGRDILLADWCVRNWLDYAQRRDGGLPAGSAELRDFLAEHAGRQPVIVADRGSPPGQVSARRGSTSASGAAIMRNSGPEMTTAEVAAWLGVTPRAIRYLCGSGDLIARRGPSGRWAIDANSAAAAAVSAARKEHDAPAKAPDPRAAPGPAGRGR